MNNRQINFYQFKGKPPFYVFPLMLVLVILIICVLSVFWLFIGISVSKGVKVIKLLRLITSFGSKKKEPLTSRNDRDTTTITLDESDYEIIEKEDKT
jgi:hypothetical protein